MRKEITIIFTCLFLSSASFLNAETSGQKQVALAGETVITAKSAKLNVRVSIKTHKVEKDVTQKWGKQLSFVPSTCTFSSWCSIVDDINIKVNDKKIFIPHSLISDLAILDTTEIRFEKENMMLFLEEGDASESYYVKIEFDRERVNRMSVYADDSMEPNMLLQETSYHLVSIN